MIEWLRCYKNIYIGDIMRYQKRKWYRLDNTGKLYPSITNTRVSTVFRLSATLREEVDPIILQKALGTIIMRFPYYKVNLKKGLFWYYFEYVDHYPIVEQEIYDPCMFMQFKKKKTFPFRVLYYHHKISCEFSHSITDATGAMIFLKSLLGAYFELLGNLTTTDGHKIRMIKREEYEDAAHRYYRQGIPSPDSPKKAMHFPFSLMGKGEYKIITGIMSINRVKGLAEKYNCSLTVLLLALYFETIQDFVYEQDKDLRKKLMKRMVINVPVNLRNIFPSSTMKNFFISLTPTIDLRLGRYSFEELIQYVQLYMKMNLNKKYLSRYISRNVKKEKNRFIRIIPLFIKNLVIPFVYQYFGESGYTSSISNLGRMELSENIASKIERFEFYPPPSRGNIIKVGVISYRTKLYLSFGSLTNRTDIERIFFRKLRKMGLPVKVETNKR